MTDEELKNLPIEYEDEGEYVEGDIVEGAGAYKAPSTKTGVINTLTGEVEDNNENIGPWDVITAVSKQLGIKIQDPNKNCKKCFGRGWIGRIASTKQPVPCQCIYPEMTADEQKRTRVYQDKMSVATMNRKQKRAMFKRNKGALRKIAKERGYTE